VLGRANQLADGEDAAIIAAGEMTRYALDAALELRASGIGVRVLDMHTLKPLDEQAVVKVAEETRFIVTVEEHSIYGGLGAAVAQVVAEHHAVPVKVLGLPDEPIISGESVQVFAHYGLDAAGISRTIREKI
jgi:transketolase